MRELTRSVSALIVPPFPAASRPSNTMMTRSPLCFTHSCNSHSLPCSLRSSFVYWFLFIFSRALAFAGAVIGYTPRTGSRILLLVPRALPSNERLSAVLSGTVMRSGEQRCSFVTAKKLPHTVSPIIYRFDRSEHAAGGPVFVEIREETS